MQHGEAAPGEKSPPPQTVHTVCLNLREQCDLWQQRDGKVRRHVQPYGETIFMPAGFESHWKWTTPASALYLLVEPDLVSRTAAEIGLSSFEMTNNFGATDPRLLHLALTLREEAQTGGIGGSLFLQCLSTAVAAHLLTHYSAAPLAAAAPSGHGLSASQIKRVTEHIKDHLHSGLSLAEIAETVHISPFHFARQFKRTTGKTLHEFVLECRVDAAKSLLRRPNLSVGQVASQAGFAQQSHLAAHFKRVIGLSPLAFRRQFGKHESAQNAQEFD